jgi:hypothetical protein
MPLGKKGHTPVPGRLSKRMVAKWRSVGSSQRDSRLLRGSALAGENLIHPQPMPAGTTPWFDPFHVECSRNTVEASVLCPQRFHAFDHRSFAGQLAEQRRGFTPPGFGFLA